MDDAEGPRGSGCGHQRRGSPTSPVPAPRPALCRSPPTTSSDGRPRPLRRGRDTGPTQCLRPHEGWPERAALSHPTPYVLRTRMVAWRPGRTSVRRCCTSSAHAERCPWSMTRSANPPGPWTWHDRSTCWCEAMPCRHLPCDQRRAGELVRVRTFIFADAGADPERVLPTATGGSPPGTSSRPTVLSHSRWGTGWGLAPTCGRGMMHWRRHPPSSSQPGAGMYSDRSRRAEDPPARRASMVVHWWGPWPARSPASTSWMHGWDSCEAPGGHPIGVPGFRRLVGEHPTRSPRTSTVMAVSALMTSPSAWVYAAFERLLASNSSTCQCSFCDQDDRWAPDRCNACWPTSKRLGRGLQCDAGCGRDGVVLRANVSWATEADADSLTPAHLLVMNCVSGAALAISPRTVDAALRSQPDGCVRVARP